MVDVGELCAIGSRLTYGLQLRGQRGNAIFVEHRQFARRRALLGTAAATVVTDVQVIVVGYVVVVDVTNDRRIHVIDRPVVGECAPVLIPVAALVTSARVARTVVDAAVVADVRAPVAAIEAVAGIGKFPVGWSPERANVGRNNPSSRNPVVTSRSIAPVAGSPNIVVAWTRRLAVCWQGRRRLFGLHWFLC